MGFGFGLRSFCVIASMLSAATPTSACYAIDSTINYNYLGLIDAQVIVRAVIRSYRVISRENLPEHVQAYAIRQGVAVSQGEPIEAILELDVIETVRGYPKRPNWSLVVSAGGEGEWKWPRNVILGIRPYVGDDGTSVRVGAIEHGCYRGRFLEDTPEHVETVEATLLSVYRKMDMEEVLSLMRGGGWKRP